MVDPVTLSGIFSIGKSLIEKIWPDPAKQSEALFKLQELEQKGDIAQMQAYVQVLTGQLQINLKEAEHSSLWVAGWRPAVGWVCALSLALAYVPKSLAITGMWIYQNIAIIRATADMSNFEMLVFPDLGITELIGLLMSMLGIGVMRSIDKFNKVDTKLIGDK